MLHEDRIAKVLGGDQELQSRFDADMKGIIRSKHPADQKAFRAQQLVYALALKEGKEPTPSEFWRLETRPERSTVPHYDFGDGNGCVPAHKHYRGGGWVADTAFVSKMAYVGPEARVYGMARVRSYARLLDRVVVKDSAEVGMHVLLRGDVVLGGSTRCDL